MIVHIVHARLNCYCTSLYLFVGASYQDKFCSPTSKLPQQCFLNLLQVWSMPTRKQRIHIIEFASRIGSWISWEALKPDFNFSWLQTPPPYIWRKQGCPISNLFYNRRGVRLSLHVLRDDSSESKSGGSGIQRKEKCHRYDKKYGVDWRLEGREAQFFSFFSTQLFIDNDRTWET